MQRLQGTSGVFLSKMICLADYSLYQLSNRSRLGSLLRLRATSDVRGDVVVIIHWRFDRFGGRQVHSEPPVFRLHRRKSMVAVFFSSQHEARLHQRNPLHGLGG